MTWYVMHGSADYDEPHAKPVTEPPASEDTWPHGEFTISEDPCRAGWGTDGAHPGYGMPYAKARYICDVLNAHEAVVALVKLDVGGDEPEVSP